MIQASKEYLQSLLNPVFLKKSQTEDEWKTLLKNSITTPEQLANICKQKIDAEDTNDVVEKYPMLINPYYLSLVKKKNDAIWKQCIPDKKELSDPKGLEDPLCEEKDSPVQGLTHRYPDRVLLLVSNSCAMYCRFCTRKRKVGHEERTITKEQIAKGIEYISKHPEVRDVIVSGGDPLMLSDNFLEWVLKELRKIPHVEIIRIGTRIPVVLPHRITPELAEMIKRYHPVYINTHFNHPDEITAESSKACNMLADAGIPLGNQTVLLKGINDNPLVMRELMKKLLTIRVRPYYIYQADLVKGSNHFRTSVKTGVEIIKNIRGWTSGLAVPHYVIDAPGGGGKIPLLPEYVQSMDDDKVVLKNYKDNTYEYEQHKDEF